MIRSGRIREPMRSDHRPAAMRPSAPSICERPTSTPAHTIDRPCLPTNQTSMNVSTTGWGTISSADARWMRHNTGLRYRSRSS